MAEEACEVILEKKRLESTRAWDSSSWSARERVEDAF